MIATLATLALLAAPADAGVAAPVDAGPAETFTTQAPTAPIRLGEPFGYTIAVTHPKGEVVALPREVELGDFDLVDQQKADAPSGEQVTTTLQLSVRGWALGKKKLPEIPLVVQHPDGFSTGLAVPGPEVELVGDLDPDGGASAPLRDIAPPVSIPVRTYRVLAWLAGALAALALGFALYKRLTREKPVVAAPAPPPEPAHVRAQRALEALLKEDLPGQGRQREFYFRLSETTRRYLGERFGFDAIDLTTEELLAALRTRPTPGLDFARFKELCLEADLAKFAKSQPSTEVCKASIDVALALVQATTPAFAPGSSGEAKAS